MVCKTFGTLWALLRSRTYHAAKKCFRSLLKIKNNTKKMAAMIPANTKVFERPLSTKANKIVRTATKPVGKFLAWETDLNTTFIGKVT
jgi:hypothetical protein